MTSHPVFTRTEPDLLAVLEELRRLEPIFHTPEFGVTPEEFERRTLPGYWEVGASGRRYSREFILRSLAATPPADADAAGWLCWDHALQRFGPETYLITYTLQQGTRLTRRSTIWQSTPHGWAILYHQGTVVEADEDDIHPTQP
jgi:hypothetical protein